MKIERLPLNALRAFAEATREGSFKAAATRLNVTPGAVSRQVKQLEEHLDTVLFERHPNGVRPTLKGQLLAQDIDAGLQRIADAIAALHTQSQAAFSLLISAPPSFSQLWLLPRLADFETRGEQVTISVDASQSFSEPSWHEEGARLALRYGRAPWSGVKGIQLFEDVLIPVCSPHLLERSPISKPSDLLDHTLFEVSWRTQQRGGFPGWRDWFAAAGLTNTSLSGLRHYSLYGLALDQTIAARGVMLASYPLVADRLESGVLACPLGDAHALASPFTYELVMPRHGTPPAGVDSFIDWLLATATHFRQHKWLPHRPASR